MSIDPMQLGAAATAALVRSGALSAAAAAEAALARIADVNGRLNAFTEVTAERARRRAAAIDARHAQGHPLGALAGAVFAVKNLFDVEGIVTLAGSKINCDDPPAKADAALIARLEAADAILVGCLNMGEYAYDFTGENSHYGPSRNPRNPDHMAGGSSGGSASAVAANMVSFALASDTNGSIRVPASFCGLYGLKPTYGRLSRNGTFPFVTSLDHLGPLARSPEDLALIYDAMQGDDPSDPVQAHRAAEPSMPALRQGLGSLRIARADGYFARSADPAVLAAVEGAAEQLGATRLVELPEVARARAAAYLITMAEGAALHLGRINMRAADFDPDVRERLMAGAMLPGAWIVQAQKFRRWYQQKVLALFEDVDVIIAPSAPCTAPRIGQKNMVLDGVEMAVRANLGLFTQPISFIGLPVVAAPAGFAPNGLPIGIQIIAAPWREDTALRVAAALAASGFSEKPQ